MIWRCSDDAKWSDFGIRTGNTYNLRHHFDATQDIPPRDKKVVFGIGLRRDTLKSRYLKPLIFMPSGVRPTV